MTDGRAFADFHIHTRFSPDSRLGEDKLIELAIKRGLTHIAVTDHNTVSGAEAVRERVEALGVGDRLRVIIGEEVSSADGEIVGVFLQRTIPRGMTAEETVDAIHEQGGLASIPHAYDPFRKHHITEDALNRLAESGRIDMVEVFNSRVTFSRHNHQAAEFAAAHGLPTIACSDCHTAMEVAMSSNSLPPFETADELRAGLRDNVWQGSRSTMFIHLATRYAVMSKRLTRAFQGGGRND